jgi:hypothetical protein
VSWRDELKEAVSKDDDKLSEAKAAKESKEAHEKQQRQAARELMQREVIPGIEHVKEELGALGREVHVRPQLENIEPRINVTLSRPGRDSFKLQIEARITADGFTMDVRDLDMDNMPVGFPQTKPEITRQNVSAAVVQAYNRSLVIDR